jgi:hypothetical protein
MPILTPSRRWQKPYSPFKGRSVTERIEAALERSLKGALWGCRMCGNCLLQETAFICPMACSKGLRNGPCGGSTPEHCCVDETRPCKSPLLTLIVIDSHQKINYNQPNNQIP